MLFRSNVKKLSDSAQLEVTKVKSVAVNANEIAAVAEENASATEEASAAVEQQTAQTQEIATSASQMSELAEQLQKLISRFKITADAGAEAAQEEGKKPGLLSRLIHN